MKKILVTAGPTREAIDRVRFITNASSGRMGYALARAAALHGHAVKLISGPVELPPPPGVTVERVVSAGEMAEAVLGCFRDFDAVIMTAAVADYRPAEVFDGKIKKSPGGMSLKLERTVDILESMGRLRGKERSPLLVGFAAEYGGGEEEPRAKLARKGCDWLVFNDVSVPGIGFGAAANRVIVFGASGERVPLALADKEKIAREILEITGL